MEIPHFSLYRFCKFQRRIHILNQRMVLVNLKAHRMDANLPKESSNAIIGFENEPLRKKERSIEYYLQEVTKIPVPKKSLKAEKSKSS